MGTTRRRSLYRRRQRGKGLKKAVVLLSALSAWEKTHAAPAPPPPELGEALRTYWYEETPTLASSRKLVDAFTASLSSFSLPSIFSSSSNEPLSADEKNAYEPLVVPYMFATGDPVWVTEETPGALTEDRKLLNSPTVTYQGKGITTDEDGNDMEYYILNRDGEEFTPPVNEVILSPRATGGRRKQRRKTLRRKK